VTSRLSPAALLADMRGNATPFLADQAKQFRALSASDQRELLFYLMANMAVSQAASRMLDATQGNNLQ